ncbi:MAG: bis(5'-nucleosyl)-tetraphosphatase (symmetrical) YqeK [Clostridia bacterium]|nr:bis(5'-nucleosyl)-tetraphosphatase (symmetrical) YqeK [Clostridia bacterium]
MSCIDEYKELLRSRLSDYRYHHSLCVADSAVELAERYGADKDKAFVAGLLHDITKEATADEHAELFSLGGVQLSELERVNRKLWHAMSGAVYIKEKLNITDCEILDAVRYHTTARAGMSLLEKVIYIADFISADRDYNDVDVVRELAEKSIEETMLYTQRYSINELVFKGACVHPDSVACYNEILLNK